MQKYLIISIIFILNMAKGQTFFKDGAIWHGYNRQISMSKGFGHFDWRFIDSIHLDSIATEGEYYSVFRAKEDRFKPMTDKKLSFKLRVNSRQLFYTGYYFLNEDSVFLNDRLIWDYSLAQDAILNINLVLDSFTFTFKFISNIPYADGKLRKTIEYQGGHSFLRHPAIEGFGSGHGLIYFQNSFQNWAPIDGPNLLCICDSMNMIYSSEEWYGSYGIMPNCNEDSIRAQVELSNRLEAHYPHLVRIKIFPNPAGPALKIDINSPQIVDYDISNMQGVKILTGTYNRDQYIPLADLEPGLYAIKIRIGNSNLAFSKFVKL